jgi:carbon monoxide dehydrogenase subunit G
VKPYDKEEKSMGEIVDIRKQLKSNPETAKFLMPSTKYEALFDLDGDGRMDFALMDTTGDGIVDTFAIDTTGNGSLNLYFYDSDGNGIADTVEYYPDGSDAPTYSKIDKASEENTEKLLGGIDGAIASGDPNKIVECLNGIKQYVAEKAKTYNTAGALSLVKLRSAMKAEFGMGKLLCASPKNEIFLDLNGDGITDFALIDRNHSNKIETIAMDLYGDGEFDLYLIDTDDNGIPDKAEYYKTGDDEPTLATANTVLEEALRPATEKFLDAIRADFNAQSVIDALNAYKLEVIAAMKPLRAQVEAEAGK